MKNIKILVLILFSVISFNSCKDNPSSKVREIPEGTETPNTTTPTDAANTTATTEAAQNAAGVWHYTCPNGDAGGAGSAVACSFCGATLTHNAAYHGNTNTNSNSNSSAAPFDTAPASGQNTAGVFHYTCPKNDGGGAGSAGTCSICGTTLVHNQAYHQ